MRNPAARRIVEPRDEAVTARFMQRSARRARPPSAGTWSSRARPDDPRDTRNSNARRDGADGAGARALGTIGIVILTTVTPRTTPTTTQRALKLGERPPRDDRPDGVEQRKARTTGSHDVADRCVPDDVRCPVQTTDVDRPIRVPTRSRAQAAALRKTLFRRTVGCRACSPGFSIRATAVRPKAGGRPPTRPSIADSLRASGRSDARGARSEAPRTTPGGTQRGEGGRQLSEKSPPR